MKYSVHRQQGVASIIFVLSIVAILVVNFFAFQSLIRINKQVRLGDAAEAAALGITDIADFQLANVIGMVDLPYPTQGEAETYASNYVNEYLGSKQTTATILKTIKVVRKIPHRRHISYTVTPTITDYEIFPDAWNLQNDTQDISNQGKAAKGFQGPINVAFVSDFSGSMRGYPLATLKAVTTELIAYLNLTNKGSKIGLYPFNTAFHTLPFSREFVIPLMPDLAIQAQSFIATFGMLAPGIFELCVVQPPGTSILPGGGPGPCPSELHSTVAKSADPVFRRYRLSTHDVMAYKFPIDALNLPMAHFLLDIPLPSINGVSLPIPGISPSLVQSSIPGPLYRNPLWGIEPLSPVNPLFHQIPMTENFPIFTALFAPMSADGWTSVLQGMIPAARGLIGDKKADDLRDKHQKYVMIVMSDGNENFGFEAFTTLAFTGWCQRIKEKMIGPDDDVRDFQMAYIGIPFPSPSTIAAYGMCFGPENVFAASNALEVRDRILTIMSRATDTKLYYRYGKVFGE